MIDSVIRTFSDVGKIALVLRTVVVTVLRELSRGKFRLWLVIEQMFAMGLQSIPVLVVAVTFVSLMMVMELSFHMRMLLGQDSLVPAFSTLLMLRELAPVVTCLLLASKIGAGISAEFATMRVTEQLDALDQLGIDPISYLVVPRWIASVVCCVGLTVISVLVSIVGGILMAASALGYTWEQYFHSMLFLSRFSDLMASAGKAACFGTLIPVVATYYGFRAVPTSEGVGNAATSAVVMSSVGIITVDFLLTYLFYAV